MNVPAPKKMLNAFSPTEAARITGLSVHMLNYLARHTYLKPAYGSAGRGSVRYYSYRDLIIARIIARLLAAGLEISRLKKGIASLVRDPNLSTGDAQKDLRLLATDGSALFFVERDGGLRDLTKDGQLAFAFVLDVGIARDEVVAQMSDEELRYFNLEKRRLQKAA
ncbi:MerR family transcriptional regulator [Sphingomonas sp. ST-64]|uniref:MerR family transcriptional regulator n=1 Tax=Sphingomonas plantiphila TaxID=3163295 RepID=A0ABW8YK81_9SPHN